jgi:hypothetical protein
VLNVTGPTYVTMILLLPRSQVHERLRNATVHLYISQELIGLMERVSGVDNFASQHRVLSRLSVSQTARVHREGGRSQICLIQVCAVDMVCIVRQYMPVPALEQLWLSAATHREISMRPHGRTYCRLQTIEMKFVEVDSRSKL